MSNNDNSQQKKFSANFPFSSMNQITMNTVSQTSSFPFGASESFRPTSSVQLWAKTKTILDPFDKFSKQVQHSMSNDQKSLLESGDYSDFTIEVEATEFKVHKSIIAARSSLLARLLFAKDQEAPENRMKIDDVSAVTFRSILDYIYTGSVSDMDQQKALDLLALADKFEVTLLKEICTDYLLSTINVFESCDLAGKIFETAYKHNCSDDLIQTSFRAVKNRIEIPFAMDHALIDHPEEVLQLLKLKKKFEKDSDEVKLRCLH